MKTLSLRDANQSFARCIRQVEAGEVIVITRNGTPVAKLSPIASKRVLTAEQQDALQRTRQRMDEGWELQPWTFNRDELYDR